MTVSPTPGPHTASSIAAVSRIVRLMHSPTPGPDSSPDGPALILPCDGFRPTTPQHAAGIRMEPDPSVACATGTMPEATAAAAPPLDPPGEQARFHGLRVAPHASGSVVTWLANSGVFVRPAITRPAARNLDTRAESARAGRAASFNRRLPLACGCPA